MFIKELPHLTLRDLLEEEVPATRTFTVPASEIAVHTHGDTDDAIRIGAKDYPFTETGLLALGQFIGIPSTFLAERLPRDLVDTVVNRMLSVQGGDIDVAVTDSGLQDVFAPNGRRLDPHQVLEVAARVMNADDQVVGWRRNNQGYSFEVIEAFLDHQVTEVNDISRGGLRFGQETKHNEAPWVQPYIYRLLCTNGMEIPDETLKVTSQGRTIEELLEDLEASATAAFARVGNDIDSFYHLKEQRVAHPEKTLARYAREQGFNDRRTRLLIESIAEHEDEDGSTSEFALVNAITNQANDPALAFTAARNLQRAGGNLAFSHTVRCGQCASKLV